MPTDIPRILECQNCSHYWCYKCAYIQYFKDVKTPPYLALKFCVNSAEPFDIPGVQILLAVLAWGDKIWKGQRDTFVEENYFDAYLFLQNSTPL